MFICKTRNFFANFLEYIVDGIECYVLMESLLYPPCQMILKKFKLNDFEVKKGKIFENFKNLDIKKNNKYYFEKISIPRDGYNFPKIGKKIIFGIRFHNFDKIIKSNSHRIQGI